MRLVMLAMLISSIAHGAVNLKLAVLVPEGTTWADGLRKFAKEVESATSGEVTFKLYYGGVAGDEPDVLRKVRIGQMSGGIFTGKTLGDIAGDVRVPEIPFTFQSDRARAWAATQKLAPRFNQLLEAKGYVGLGFFEVGQVYIVSTKKIDSLAALKGVKVWAWEGDDLVKAMVDSLGLVSVPLAITDVLSSLSTGIIDAAYAPPLGIIALQWHTKVKYLVDFPTAWSLGALLVSKKDWSKIPTAQQKMIRSIASRHVAEANARTVLENDEAKRQLQKMGVSIVPFPAAEAQKAVSFRQQVVDKLRGKLFSPEILSALEQAR